MYMVYSRLIPSKLNLNFEDSKQTLETRLVDVERRLTHPKNAPVINNESPT